MASSSPRVAASPDSFEDASENLMDWFRERSRPLAIGALTVVALGAGALLWRSTASSKAARAETAYFQAQAPIAQNDLAAAERELRTVADQYKGTAGGAQARMLLAQVLYEQGRYQAGIDALKAGDAPGALQTSVKVLTAGGYEGLGQPLEAAKLYEEAATAAVAGGQRDELRASAARAYQAGGRTADAQKIWTELAANEQSPLADEARVRLGELAPKPAS